MRVTKAVRLYVEKVLMDKVRIPLDEAVRRKEAERKRRDELVKRVRDIATKKFAQAHASLVKEWARLGLTWVSDTYTYSGNRTDKQNVSFETAVGECDFAELMSCDTHAAKAHPNKVREEYRRLCAEPQRIRDAVSAAADKICFDLEIGAVAKRELDKLLKETEVKL